ncbi:hypothetical protein [Mesorhizobium sp. A556]
MFIKILAASVLTLGLATTAMAQSTTPDASATPTATPDPSVFDKTETMATFYTDSDMKAMKSDEDFKAAWMAMAQEDRDAFSKECDTDTEKLHNDFCEKTKQLGGAN